MIALKPRSQTRVTDSFAGLALITLVALGAGGCASAQRTNEPGRDDIAAMPYTARELRQALPAGSKISLRMEDERGAVTVEEWEVTESTPERCTIAIKVNDERGKLIEDKGETAYSWNELRDQAAFPADQTVRSEGTLTVPVGVRQTWLYVVTGETDEGKEIESYYQFAKDLPGPPVQMSVVVEGRIILKMTMIGRR